MSEDTQTEAQDGAIPLDAVVSRIDRVKKFLVEINRPMDVLNISPIENPRAYDFVTGQASGVEIAIKAIEDGDFSLIDGHFTKMAK